MGRTKYFHQYCDHIRYLKKKIFILIPVFSHLHIVNIDFNNFYRGIVTNDATKNNKLSSMAAGRTTYAANIYSRYRQRSQDT